MTLTQRIKICKNYECETQKTFWVFIYIRGYYLMAFILYCLTYAPEIRKYINNYLQKSNLAKKYALTQPAKIREKN